MDMSDRTREELDARLGTVEGRIDRRFAEMDAKTEVRFAEADAKTEVRFAQAEARNETRFAELSAKIDTRFAQADANLQRKINDLIKWMIGTAIAATAIGAGIVGFVLNNLAVRPAAPVVITIPAPLQPGPAH
jgi:hypothetical protein